MLQRIRRDYPYLQNDASQRRFLEIGCGIGRLMRLLAGDCAEIHGIDISPEMIAAGRARLSHLSHAHFHTATSSDLSSFADDYFDLVYSFAVFQHIPSRTVVYNYLDEAFRVLRPGGICTAQFNSAPPFSEHVDTWVGAWIAETDLLSHARERGWQVLSSEGADTPYLWLTMRRPLTQVTATHDGPVVGILAAVGGDGGSQVFAGGPQGFASVYVSGLPDAYADLNHLAAHLGQHRAYIRYLGPAGPGNHRQLNVYIPETVPAGRTSLTLHWNGKCITPAPFGVEVLASPPLPPKIVRISDGDEFHLDNVIRCGRMQISMEGCRDISTLQATVAGLPAKASEHLRVEPLRRYYLVNLPLPGGVVGRQQVRLSVDGVDLPPWEVDILST